MIYKVTTELKTSWWLKILRFFRIKNKRQEFYVSLDNKSYIFETGTILETSGCKIKVISAKKE